MKPRPIVLDHAYKHGLSEEDIVHAWRNALAIQRRPETEPLQYVSVGHDRKGRLLQLVFFFDRVRRRWTVFHAMKATKSVMREVGVL